MTKRIRGPEDFRQHFGVSQETLEKLELYESLLKQWQKKINLVAPSTLDEVWHRHFADSAQLLKLAPETAQKWVDLGSGAGFPGMVLAILRSGRGLQSDLEPYVFIESDQRKAAFLGEIARKTFVAVDIVISRIELSSTQGRYKSVDVVTARALAPLNRLIGLAKPFYGPGTKGFFLKGRDVLQEVEQARTNWSFECEFLNSITDEEARIAVVTSPEARSEG